MTQRIKRFFAENFGKFRGLEIALMKNPEIEMRVNQREAEGVYASVGRLDSNTKEYHPIGRYEVLSFNHVLPALKTLSMKVELLRGAPEMVVDIVGKEVEDMFKKEDVKMKSKYADNVEACIYGGAELVACGLSSKNLIQLRLVPTGTNISIVAEQPTLNDAYGTLCNINVAKN